MISNGGQVVNDNLGFVSDYSGSSNSVLVTGSGSIWKNGADLYIGLSGGNNSVAVSNGGQLFNNGSCYVGYDGNSSSNIVIVTGSSSVWSNLSYLWVGCRSPGNSLVISNGGTVFMGDNTGYIRCYVGGFLSSSNNSVRVTGPGSTWSGSYPGSILGGSYFFYVGDASAGNSLVISNGGQVVNFFGRVGDYSSSSNNTVRVTDNAIWQNNILYVGNQGSGNSLVVAGGSVFATNLVIGVASAGCDNVVQLDSGSVIVSNATADAVLEVRSGQFILNGGVLQADILVVTNPCARFIRNGGTLLVGSLVLDPNLSAVGDGIPNGWKQQYGLDPFDPNLGGEDSDGDGFNNLQEYLAGTNPTNSASYLQISSLLPTGADVLVSWTTVGGKSYAVQTNSAPDSNFGDVSPVIAVPGDGESVTNYLDEGAATNNSARYYRIRLVP